MIYGMPLGQVINNYAGWISIGVDVDDALPWIEMLTPAQLKVLINSNPDILILQMLTYMHY